MPESVVEATVEEGSAESLMLTAAFHTGKDDIYQYNIKDLSGIMNSAPSFIKITNVPRQGVLVVK